MAEHNPSTKTVARRPVTAAMSGAEYTKKASVSTDPHEAWRKASRDNRALSNRLYAKASAIWEKVCGGLDRYDAPCVIVGVYHPHTKGREPIIAFTLDDISAREASERACVRQFGENALARHVKRWEGIANDFLDQRNARDEALREAGYFAAEDAGEKAFDEHWRYLRLIVSTTPKTNAGARIVAETLADMLRGNSLYADKVDCRAARTLVRALGGK